MVWVVGIGMSLSVIRNSEYVSFPHTLSHRLIKHDVPEF